MLIPWTIDPLDICPQELDTPMAIQNLFPFRANRLICCTVVGYCILLLGILWSTPTGICQENQDYLSQLCIIRSSEINENSGIATSLSTDDAIWTHNDSGGKPKAYLVSQNSGKTLASVTLKGANNRDWEDISTFGRGTTNYVMVADVGDNKRQREDYQLYLFEEPTLESVAHDTPKEVTTQLEDWSAIRFQYEDGSHNCEAITVDPDAGQVILLEKIYPRDQGVPGVYLLDLPDNPSDERLTAKRIADIPIKNITAMGLSPDTKRMVVRTYVDGYLYERNEDQTWSQALRNNQPKRLALPMQRQGEGVCFSRDGQAIICSSEFKRAPLWQIQLKELK